METSKNDTQLSPGLSLTACVTYTFKRPSLLHAIIPIEIDGEVLDYRVLCTLTVEGVSIEPKSIDFGVVDVGYKSDLKIITIRNKGGKSTRCLPNIVSGRAIAQSIFQAFESRMAILVELSAATMLKN